MNQLAQSEFENCRVVNGFGPVGEQKTFYWTGLNGLEMLDFERAYADESTYCAGRSSESPLPHLENQYQSDKRRFGCPIRIISLICLQGHCG